MSEMSSSSDTPAQQTASSASTEVAATEHRQAYGTAKTEDLRDSGAWRILLPGFVMLCCLGLIAVPLIILIPLLATSLDAKAATHGLIWVWVTMIVIVLAGVAVMIRGLLKIFLTQAGNY